MVHKLPVKAHILVATPTYTGEVANEFSQTMTLAAQQCIMRGVFLDPRFASGFSLVEYARNWLVKQFLDSSATHLLWYDADVFAQPDAIHRMYARDLDVVGGCYVAKHPTAPFFPYEAAGPVVNGLQKTIKVPGGFLLMKRHVVEKVCETVEWIELEHEGVTSTIPRMFDLEVRDIKGSKRLVGEDYIACERIRTAGFDIYVETDVDFIHFGRKGWPGNLAKTLREEARSGFEGQGTIDDATSSADNH